MHFWFSLPLAKDLSNGQVTEKQGMFYYLVSTLLILTQVQYALWWGPRSGWMFNFEFITSAVIACAGCIQCWKVSGGEHFVFKAICLSVPAGVQVFVLSLIFRLILLFNAESIFDPTTFRDPMRAYEIVSYTGFTGFAIYFWVIIYRGLARANKSPQDEK